MTSPRRLVLFESGVGVGVFEDRKSRTMRGFVLEASGVCYTRVDHLQRKSRHLTRHATGSDVVAIRTLLDFRNTHRRVATGEAVLVLPMALDENDSASEEVELFQENRYVRWPAMLAAETQDAERAVHRVDALDGFASLSMDEFLALGRVLVPVTPTPEPPLTSPFLLSSPHYLREKNDVVRHVYQRRLFPVPRTQEELERFVPPEFRYPVELIMTARTRGNVNDKLSPTSTALFSTRVDEHHGVSWEVGSEEDVLFYLTCLMLSCDATTSSATMQQAFGDADVIPPRVLSPVAAEWEERTPIFGIPDKTNGVTVISVINFDDGSDEKHGADAVSIELGMDGFVSVRRSSSLGHEDTPNAEIYAPDCVPRLIRSRSESSLLPSSHQLELHPLVRRMRAIQASHLLAAAATTSRAPAPRSSVLAFGVVSQKRVPDVGSFTLFSNNKVVAIFDDRTVVDLDLGSSSSDGIAKVMLPTGEIRRVNVAAPPLSSSHHHVGSAFTPFIHESLVRYLRYTQAFIRAVTTTPEEKREALELRHDAEQRVPDCRELIQRVLSA